MSGFVVISALTRCQKAARFALLSKAVLSARVTRAVITVFTDVRSGQSWFSTCSAPSRISSAGLSPIAAARQIGLGRSTVYREISRTGIERAP